MLSQQLTIIKVLGHSKDNMEEGKENQLANRATKEAALQDSSSIKEPPPIGHSIHTILATTWKDTQDLKDIIRDGQLHVTSKDNRGGFLKDAHLINILGFGMGQMAALLFLQSLKKLY